MTGWKRDTRTPEEQAKERLGATKFDDERLQHRTSGERAGYATAIREQVIPRDELIMELVAELIKARTELFSCRPYLPPSGWSLAHERVQNADKMITKANEHGYTPER